ncbi:MAG TPA: MarR family transcriptional regulator [Aldersonia sp.]
MFGDQGGTRGGQARDAESLSEAFWGVARILRQQSRESLAPWDIAPSHLRALRVLMQEGPCRLSQLSERLRIARRSTTEVVDALEQRWLVERRPDPTDRRATLVALTAKGGGVGDAVQESRAIEAERVFGALDDAERRELARILRKLAE